MIISQNPLWSAVIDALDGFRDRAYGWGGKDYLPMREDAYLFVTWTLSLSATEVPAGLPGPMVSLTKPGTILMSLQKDDRTLMVEIPCGSVIKYRRHWDHGAEIEGVIRWECDFVNDRASFAVPFEDELRWLATGEG